MNYDVSNYVHGAFRSRQDDAKRFFADEWTPEDVEDFGAEDQAEAIAQYPLAVDVQVHVVVCISTGGPHEEIDAIVSGGEVVSASFVCVWAGERREVTLAPADPLWMLAQWYVETQSYVERDA